MNSITCFLLDRTDLVRVSLRRHSSGCSNGSYHNAKLMIGQEKFSAEMSLYRTSNGPIQMLDPRWPAVCEHCGKAFKEDDAKQYFTEHLYRRTDTKELLVLRDAPVGAMWFAESVNGWYDNKKGPDGRSLVVKTPGGDWCVDGRAWNCDSTCENCKVPYVDHQQTGCGQYVDSKPDHKCWVRHGSAPSIHVDKAGLTCGVGSSIMQGSWHGFLHHGCLHE